MPFFRKPNDGRYVAKEPAGISRLKFDVGWRYAKKNNHFDGSRIMLAGG